ncbi:H-NS family nucleoid-associated regulatory protein [Chromobacterium piscinae]
MPDKQRDASRTGRGRKPLWVQELLDQGKTLEELAI